MGVKETPVSVPVPVPAPVPTPVKEVVKESVKPSKRQRLTDDEDVETDESYEDEEEMVVEGKRSARTINASMRKKMTVNKDDMLLVTKNTRGNHHVFINVTRLQQLIRSEGHKVEKDPFIVLLGRLPATQFVTGAMFDKAVSASLRVQGSKSQAREGSSRRSSPLAEDGSVEPSEKRVKVKGVTSQEVKGVSEAKESVASQEVKGVSEAKESVASQGVKGVSEAKESVASQGVSVEGKSSSASQETKESSASQETNNASLPQVKNEPAPSTTDNAHDTKAQTLSVKCKSPTPPEPSETVLVPVMFNATPKQAKVPWVFLGSEAQPSIHTFADYVRFFPSLQPSAAVPFIDHVTRSNTVKFTKKDASTVVRGVGW